MAGLLAASGAFGPLVRGEAGLAVADFCWSDPLWIRADGFAAAVFGVEGLGAAAVWLFDVAVGLAGAGRVFVAAVFDVVADRLGVALALVVGTVGVRGAVSLENPTGVTYALLPGEAQPAIDTPSPAIEVRRIAVRRVVLF